MDYNNITYNELIKSIEHWNEYRVPILRISQPDKNLSFQGAMRFYFQDAGQKVATKCVNVTSTDTTKDVIDVLIEKFRPDMRMLSVPEYGLYEIHENGDERKLSPEERPIFVQLEWNKDDREGRFLLRRMDEKTRNLAAQNEEPSLRRKLSKKEKKKQEKLKKQQLKDEEKASKAAKNKNGIAERLYNELPETSFTRSISNPEAVMKRRRAQKLEKRLQEFSLEGGPEAGGTLRIFGEAINKAVAYKTLLLSTNDTAASVVKQTLEKYGKDDEDPSNYCLVQLIVPPSATSSNGNNASQDINNSSAIRESILDDQDCPLLINQNHDKSKGILTFHIRQKSADHQKRRKKKLPKPQAQQNTLHPLVVQQLNQRLQMNNNNSEQYRDQNSPQNSSQTSGSLNHDLNNPPPPFETIHSVPTMFPTRNGVASTNMVYYPQQQQPHSISTATLPSRMSNHPQHNLHLPLDGTMPRQTFSQPNMLNNTNSRPLIPNQMVVNGQYPMSQHILTPNQPNQQYVPASGANDQILPALIQVKEDVEDIFLNTVITRIVPTSTPFRLAPTYVLYMVSRYRASTLFHPELQAPSRAELFMPFTKKIATMIRDAIESHLRDPNYLAFWLANSSDLSHFYKQDKHLSHFTIEAQEILYDSIKASFKYLLSCKQLELDAVLHTFFNERDTDNLNGVNQVQNNHTQVHDDSSVSQILNVLNETMATMRKNRVNAALTIQIFSHLFHHISKWLFDRLIGVYDNQPGLLGNRPNFFVYCNRIWGERLSKRLASIGNWAEKQGLEQAADFHLARVTQVTLFLAQRYPPTVTPNDLKKECESCDRLNPVQLRALLQRYKPEQPMVGAIIKNILYAMDYNYINSDYPLEEDFELKIPFLIPEDGYSSELIRYIPNGLLDFVSYLSKIRVRDQELCIFTVQPTSSGHWTVYFKNHQPDTPEIIMIQLRKKNSSIGMSIASARGLGQDHLGIYVRSLVANGAAAQDGRLQAGDQLLEVDGYPLIDMNEVQAREIIGRTGPVVTLKIAKQAAIYHHVPQMIDPTPPQTNVAPRVVMHPQQNHVPQPPQQHHPQIHPQQHQTQPQVQHQPPPPQIPPPQAFVPPAPSPLESNQPIHLHPHHQPAVPPPPVNLQSPIKSPKKVSWVDTQPHQSLHTLIPLPEIDPAESNHMGNDEDIPHFGRDHHLEFDRQYDDDDIQNKQRTVDEDEDTSSEDNNNLPAPPLVPQPKPQDHTFRSQEHTTATTRPLDHPPARAQEHHATRPQQQQQPPAPQQESNGNGEATTNGADTTGESLTLEDIDEVLSSQTNNNWQTEDSARVIGTQEVYNDPRMKIIKEKERSNVDVNIEKLSFKEKLRMFNDSAEK